MSAFLMAVFFRGMDAEETLHLTMEMVGSGETLDLSGVTGITADKHSTGGVGDKTSLVLVPMVASLGVKMAKMSGRGLGHTGGTLDKLESIPGFSIHVPREQFMRQLDEVGMVIAGQTADLVPADKKMYALRDVTATVNSIPLIVSSIMSKKLAAGAKTIVLDVKVGKGSFMKTEEDARELAQRMVEVGRLAQRNTVAVITDMDQPLGMTVGNALEVREAIAVLRGEDIPDFRELCLNPWRKCSKGSMKAEKR
jgi:pyrimidine-nucleoside phosphorylase